MNDLKFKKFSENYDISQELIVEIIEDNHFFAGETGEKGGVRFIMRESNNKGNSQYIQYFINDINKIEQLAYRLLSKASQMKYQISKD